MCERYSLGKTKQELESRFNAEMLEEFQPRFNIAPSQLLPVITMESPKGFSHFYWGVTPDFSKNKPVSQKFIHAKSETINQRVSYKNSFKRRRCLIPADGYYEWKKVGKKIKIPFRFVLHDNSLFSFAGIWEEYENENGQINHTFLLLTVPANFLVKDINERMPVILSKNQEQVWLDKFSQEDDLLNLMKTYPSEQMVTYPVSPMINQVSIDSEYITRKTSPMDQFGNYTLFG
ncbi:SOS response-associated peptidase [Echinicola jeungdonensis]|uniref:Abasic site processing protein n=1 Tax=Echinicola jeungdonensis TaxID=709343 RepID=A0ABV5J0Q4_9BACT|nr:SOS response-associated peptidase [Echinicola jeungdonensis]MDN3667847.1 SOS response-associated peptidase [Echinicola jeungdonensis]